ncbi:MAG: hypothetical protein IKL36_04820 [Clostridia bacterium]|nr:hypothetical protein [Clostridia bacterium]
MMRFRDKIARFMWGRYGIDGLYYGLFISYFVLIVVQRFIKVDFIKAIISLVALALLIFMFFRVFSRNIAARRKENEKFMRIWTRTKNFFVLQKNKIRDIKNFTYKKCPACKAALRLPRKKGKHNVVCPKCRNRFEVKNWF